jgi:lysophospholipase L1-like esterase
METVKKKTSLRSNLLALLIGIVVSLLLLEIALRVFHPIPFRIQHGKIILPANQKIVHKNPESNKLEKVIYYSRNSLGLRGSEMPKEPGKFVKIITIGGSTTECSYNSDSLTWPELLKSNLQKKYLNIWVNNAGLDGTSTFGHIILLKDHIVSLRPDYVIFLTGVNDMEEKAMGGFDTYHSDEVDNSSLKNYLRSIIKKTETGALIENLYRYRIAHKKGLVHRVVDYSKEKHLHLDDATINKHLAEQPQYLVNYRKRILVLDSICKANKIKAIFLTQPSLYGDYTDPATNLNFKDLQTSDGRNSILEKRILDLYNNVLLQLKAEGRIQSVDLATVMPRDSRYYYDYTHFTSAGTKVVAQIVADSIKAYISQ